MELDVMTTLRMAKAVNLAALRKTRVIIGVWLLVTHLSCMDSSPVCDSVVSERLT
jgi:hypothetical protein